MKKLSVLIALLLCVTVGGVYATWSFVDTAADIVDKKHETLVTLTDATTVGAAGTFTISSNLVLTIDQAAPGNHTAVLNFASQDKEDIYLTVTFAPAVDADKDIKENGIQAELYFKTTTTMKCYTDAEGHLVTPADPENPGSGVVYDDIFDFGNYESNSQFDNYIDWGEPDEQTGVFSVTYTEDDLKNIIKLNRTIILDTKPDYDAFSALLDGNIGAYITDGQINGESGQG